MYQLQQLRRELNISKPATAKFYLSLLLGSRNVFQDPSP
jgi:hypothetical protein